MDEAEGQSKHWWTRVFGGSEDLALHLSSIPATPKPEPVAVASEPPEPPLYAEMPFQEADRQRLLDDLRQGVVVLPEPGVDEPERIIPWTITYNELPYDARAERRVPELPGMTWIRGPLRLGNLILSELFVDCGRLRDGEFQDWQVPSWNNPIQEGDNLPKAWDTVQKLSLLLGPHGDVTVKGIAPATRVGWRVPDGPTLAMEVVAGSREGFFRAMPPGGDGW